MPLVALSDYLLVLCLVLRSLVARYDRTEEDEIRV